MVIFSLQKMIVHCSIPVFFNSISTIIIKIITVMWKLLVQKN
jgi:hypothetical protein